MKRKKEATEEHLKYLRTADSNWKLQKTLENQLRTASETERGPSRASIRLVNSES